jgi:hypothetical protein
MKHNWGEGVNNEVSMHKECTIRGLLNMYVLVADSSVQEIKNKKEQIPWYLTKLN